MALRFTPGRPCIDYRGRESLFTLRLEQGERLTATATGVARSPDGVGTWLNMRDVSISGHVNDGLPLQLDKASQVVIPASGVYTIGLSPESEAGNPGELLICKVGSE